MFQSNPAAAHPVHTYLAVKDYISRTRGLAAHPGTFTVRTTHQAAEDLDELNGRPLYTEGAFPNIGLSVIDSTAHSSASSPIVHLGVLDCLNFQLALSMAKPVGDAEMMTVPGHFLRLAPAAGAHVDSATPLLAAHDIFKGLTNEIVDSLYPYQPVRLVLSSLCLVVGPKPVRITGPTVLIPVEACWTGAPARGTVRIDIGENGRRFTLKPGVGEWVALSGGEPLVQGVLDDNAPVAFLLLDIYPVRPDLQEVACGEEPLPDEGTDSFGRTWAVPASDMLQRQFRLVASTERRVPCSPSAGYMAAFVSRIITVLSTDVALPHTVGFLLFNLYQQSAILPEFLRGTDRALFNAFKAQPGVSVAMYPVVIEENTSVCRPFLQRVRIWAPASSGHLRSTADVLDDRWNAMAFAQDEDGTDDEGTDGVGELDGPVLFLGRRHTVASLVSRGTEEDNESVWFSAAIFVSLKRVD